MVDAVCTGAWIETYTGKKFHLLDPQPDEIEIGDIAHSLSNQCRYTGHVRRFYSVAEHSVYVSFLVPESYALDALMHDASEAYLSDLSRPAKHLTDIGKPYMEIEDRIMHVIAAKFLFRWPSHSCVKLADKTMLLTEKAKLMTSLSWDDDAASEEARRTVTANLPPWINASLFGIDPSDAEDWFLTRYNELKHV